MAKVCSRVFQNKLCDNNKTPLTVKKTTQRCCVPPADCDGVDAKNQTKKTKQKMVLGGNLFPSRAGTHCLTDDGLSLPRRRRRRRAQRTTPIWRGLPRVTLRVGSRRRPARGLRGHRTPPRSSLHAGGVSVRWRRWLHRTTRLALSQPACLASPAGEGRRRRAALVARAPPLELRATGKTTQQRRSGASACQARFG